jgi:cation:H+ antiporter
MSDVVLDAFMLGGGGLLLYFGAEWLVAGAAGLARSLGVSTLVIGLTVVAYGTSTPEVIVGMQAAFAGHSDIALANVLGSNIANLGLILGLTAILRPAQIDGTLLRREMPLLVASALVVPFLLLDGRVHRSEGVALMIVAVLYTAWVVHSSRRATGEAVEAAAVTADSADAAGAPSPRGGWARLVAIAVGGLAALVVGGQLLVEGAVGLAREIGMSERVVGLTIVAVGTSLPELVTSIIATRRGHTNIAVGNVVGSNIFNVLICLGGASVVGRVGSPLATVALDVGAMIAFTLVGVVMMRSGRTVTRIEGSILVLGYAAFLASLVVLA